MDKYAVVAVKGIIYKNEEVLIVRRSAGDKHSPGIWEFPGGKVDFGEQPEDALIREIKEETGLDVKIKTLLYASSFVVDNVKQVFIIYYFCQCGSADVCLSFEHQDWQWAKWQDFKQLIYKNILDDMINHRVFENPLFENYTQL